MHAAQHKHRRTDEPQHWLMGEPDVERDPFITLALTLRRIST